MTEEQKTATRTFTSQIHAVFPRARVTSDAEGWPYVPGRLGRVEWGGSPGALAVYTTGRLARGHVARLPGVTPLQIGDHEARYAVATDALRVVLDVIRPRVKREPRVLTEAQLAHLARIRPPKSRPAPGGDAGLI